MADALKPCPFCGGTDVRTYPHFNAEGKEVSYRQCHECSAMGPDEHDGRGWNTRAALAAGEARPDPAADVRDGVLVRSSLPVGYTGPLYAAPPQPETAVVGPRLTEPELRRLWVRMWGVKDDVPLPAGTLHVNLVQFAEAVEDAVRERIANGGTHGR